MLTIEQHNERSRVNADSYWVTKFFDVKPDVLFGAYNFAPGTDYYAKISFRCDSIVDDLGDKFDVMIYYRNTGTSLFKREIGFMNGRGIISVSLNDDENILTAISDFYANRYDNDLRILLWWW